MFKKIAIIITLILLVVVAIVLYRTFNFNSKQLQADKSAIDISINKDAIYRLADAIKLTTVSYEESGKSDTLAILKLHDVIEQSFPSVHNKLTKEVINNFSLLYEWKGKNTSLKPVILMAHMDVVPIEEANKNEWLQPPFSGNIIDGALWGRGTLDDKSGVFGILEAAEMLIKQGFQPDRTFYFVFGHDEETGGIKGAKVAAELLEKRGVKAEMVLDEGMYMTTGNMIPGITKPVALIGVAEKGYMTLELITRIKGGHSSIPSKETSIGVLAKAVAALQDNLLETHFTEPTRMFFEYVGPEMPFGLKMVVANQWLFEKVLINQMTSFREGSATFRTTTAPTIFHSGIKENVVPYEARAVVNFRLLPGDHSHEVIDKVKDIVNDERVEIKIINQFNEASPVASDKEPTFKILAKTIGQVSKEEVLISPSLVLGGTDSKHFNNISPNVFKYLHIRMDATDLKRVHGTNERILIKDYEELIRFYYQLMKNVQTMN
jgi:carboxypeptidase PM20D1